MTQRLTALLSTARSAKRKLLIPYIMAGDPSRDATLPLLDALVEGGADIIELGFPFSDPMADGPVIQEAGLRALASGTTLKSVLEIVTAFRAKHKDTPLVLMGYANPVYSYGLDDFARDASAAGVDGMLIVDLPPEESGPTDQAFKAYDLATIRLITPTTTAERIKQVVPGAGGYLYYVSITGVTGTASAQTADVSAHLDVLRGQTDLPIVIGFGIKTPEQARDMAQFGDGIVIGSALVDAIHREAGHSDAVAPFLAGFKTAIK
jgi:tryptophan synthase alpha chain